MWLGCGSRRRRAVHISHSSLAGFQHQSHSAPQLRDENACVAVTLKPLGNREPACPDPAGATVDLNVRDNGYRRSTPLRVGHAVSADGIAGLIAPRGLAMMGRLNRDQKFVSPSDPAAQWTGAMRVPAFFAYAGRTTLSNCFIQERTVEWFAGVLQDRRTAISAPEGAPVVWCETPRKRVARS